jgi:hypothetical protein
MSPIYSHRWRILLEMIVVSPAGELAEITDRARTRDRILARMIKG